MKVAIWFCLLALSTSSISSKEQRDYLRRELAEQIEQLLLEVRSENNARNILTYNLGMSEDKPNLESRRLGITGVMTKVDADLVCLQEVYSIDDKMAVLDAIGDRYDFVYSFSQSEDLQFDFAKWNSKDPVGLLVLSKQKPVAFRREQFRSDPGNKLTEEGYIELEFEDEQTFYCTHMCADKKPDGKSQSNYMSRFMKRHHHSSSEIDQLIERVEIIHGDSVIMGTLNIDPATVEYGLETAYKKLTDHHFTSALASIGCTVCKSNPLVQQCEKCDTHMDILLLHGHFQTKDVELVFKDNIEGQNYPLSDHYGVKATVWCDAPHEHDRRTNYRKPIQ